MFKVLWPGISLLSLVTNFPLWRVTTPYWTEHQRSSKKCLCNKPSMAIFTKHSLWKVVVVGREQLEIVMKFWKRKSKTKIKYLTSLLWLAPWDRFRQNHQNKLLKKGRHNVIWYNVYMSFGFLYFLFGKCNLCQLQRLSIIPLTL